MTTTVDTQFEYVPVWFKTLDEVDHLNRNVAGNILGTAKSYNKIRRAVRDAGWVPPSPKNNFLYKILARGTELEEFDDYRYNPDNIYSLFDFVEQNPTNIDAMHLLKIIVIRTGGEYIKYADKEKIRSWSQFFWESNLLMGNWGENVWALQNVPTHVLVKSIETKMLYRCFNLGTITDVAKILKERKEFKNVPKKNIRQMIIEGSVLEYL